MARNALEGLGQGLMQVGQMMFEHNKQKMAQQLEAEREERRIAREEAKEERARQREKTTPDPSRFSYFTDDKGVVYEEVKNKFGETLERRPASPGTSEEVQLQREKDRASIESALALGEGRALDMAIKRDTVAHLAEDRALERRATEARIDATNRSNQSDQQGPPAEQEIIADILEETKSLQEAAKKKYENTDWDIYFDDLAAETLSISRRTGQDPTALFKDALKRRLLEMSKQKPTMPKTTSLLGQ